MNTEFLPHALSFSELPVHAVPLCLPCHPPLIKLPPFLHVSTSKDQRTYFVSNKTSSPSLPPSSCLNSSQSMVSKPLGRLLRHYFLSHFGDICIDNTKAAVSKASCLTRIKAVIPNSTTGPWVPPHQVLRKRKQFH